MTAVTQLYADYAPSAHEAELVAAAFARETAANVEGRRDRAAIEVRGELAASRLHPQ